MPKSNKVTINKIMALLTLEKQKMVRRAALVSCLTLCLIWCVLASRESGKMNGKKKIFILYESWILRNCDSSIYRYFIFHIVARLKAIYGLTKTIIPIR